MKRRRVYWKGAEKEGWKGHKGERKGAAARETNYMQYRHTGNAEVSLKCHHTHADKVSVETSPRLPGHFKTISASESSSALQGLSHGQLYCGQMSLI